ncbi:MAG: hypothetical protein FXF47_07745 [Candidatus Mcinerneyibacterium aminivorans]|jgi:hypothetical protein|uniref:Uncharacterized protein n=1 Tax=Candidatus Mcinerneyibacterium aminivorans TaxID=2703815 RepID=A0A5D0MAC5_9BACT|nr:MAG: hypothetical protein FXF47_07745 [Candidatus Mcinerneyibacterium aminivorans]
MSIEENGFLGEEIKKYEEKYKENNKELINLFIKINKLGNNLITKISNIKENINTDEKLCLLLLYNRLLELFQSAYILKVKGIEHTFIVLLRSIFEYFSMFCLIFDGKIAGKDFLEYYPAKQKLKFLNWLYNNTKSNNYEELKEESEDELEGLKNFINKYSEKNINKTPQKIFNKIEGMLLEANNVDELTVKRIYSKFSFFSHPTKEALQESFVQNDKISELKYGPKYKEKDLFYLMLSFYLDAISILNTIYSLDFSERIKKLGSKLNDLAETKDENEQL